jgi:CO/xanthine dehydrogenase Mo-binding subunit
MAEGMGLVGKAVLRKEGRDKVTGRAKYVDDLQFDDVLHGATVRSPVARGRISGIRFEDGVPWDEFVVVTAKDIPGKNAVALLEYDQPFLADGVVNHPEEPVVLLAHPDKHLLEEARRRVRIDIDPLPGVFDIDESLAAREVIWPPEFMREKHAHGPNVFKKFLVEKGDVDGAWARAAHVLEGEYHTGAQEQLYIENNGMIAVANPEDGVTVWGSMQCPYYIHKALLPLFALPPEKIRVIQTETGGGFGGKEEYPSILAGHVALLAWKSGQRVKIIYDRAEDMVATTKRHPSRTRIKAGVDRDGKLVALDIDFVIDGGAYLTLSPVVLSRGTIHAAGPYHCANVRVRSRAVATNTPPHGAFRGFGAPQSIFAMERHLDKLARAAGLTPEELRRRNFIREGQTTATSQLVRESVDFPRLLELAFSATDYRAKLARFAEQNARGGRVRRGIGFASFMHGAGFTGSGEKYLASVVELEGLPTGRVRVLSSSTEIGQGTNTIFAQIAADALGVDYDTIEVFQPDTRFVPNSGPTVASRTVMVVGGLVEKAAEQLRATLRQGGLLGEKFTPEEFRRAVVAHIEKFGALRSTTQYKQPAGVDWDDDKYRGDAYATYAWAVYVAEVSVDTLTYETRVEDFVAVQEAGKVIHPVLAAGQIEGGVAQGVGYALYENIVWKDGRMMNGQMTNYIMPTSADVPPIRVIFDEKAGPHGPGGGAKGIGELPMDGPAPAILNAVEFAVGVPVDRIPMTPEMLMHAMEDGP